MSELFCFPSTHLYEEGYIWLNAFADWIGEHLRVACGMEQQRGGVTPGPEGLGSTFPQVLAAVAKGEGLVL